jgi:hypothetical protein
MFVKAVTKASRTHSQSAYQGVTATFIRIRFKTSKCVYFGHRTFSLRSRAGRMESKGNECGRSAILVSKQRSWAVINEAHSFEMYPGYEIGEKTEESCLA